MVNNADSNFRITMKTLLGEGNPIYQDDEEFIAIYNRIQDLTLVSPYRCYFIYQYAKNAASLDGDFAQVGVYKGGSAQLIASVKPKNKKFYLFDTFTGLPKHNPKIDSYQQGKFSDTSIDAVRKLFKDDSNVKIIPGLFPDTTGEVTDKKFSFVYVDVDLYKSNYAALEFFYNRVVPGGVIIFDDYGWKNCKGIQKSINDFIKKNKIKERPIITTKYQCVIIKG